MNLIGHTLIASKTYELLEKEYGVSVDRAAFILGNLLPDASFRMKRPVHRIENWGKRVNELIDDLETKDFGTSRRFSLALGIVCHFISDFFCLAHNDPYYLKQVAHLKYETKQTMEFLSLLRKDTAFELPLISPLDMNAASYLARRRLDFYSREVSFEKELSSSVEVCAAICSMMIAEGLLVPSGA